jgi:hypothetical protein
MRPQLLYVYIIKEIQKKCIGRIRLDYLVKVIPEIRREH